MLSLVLVFLSLVLSLVLQNAFCAILLAVSLLTERRYISVILTVRVSDLDGVLIKRYALYNKETVSSLMKRLVMVQIEEDFRKLVEEMEEVKES